jgi:NADH:ubiquinone oxidoreductase subunit K
MSAPDGIAILLFVGAIHAALGMSAVASRRTLPHVALGAAVAMLGLVLILVAWSIDHATSPGRALAVIVVVVGCAYAVLLAALRLRWFRPGEEGDVDRWDRLRADGSPGSPAVETSPPTEEPHA